MWRLSRQLFVEGNFLSSPMKLKRKENAYAEWTTPHGKQGKYEEHRGERGAQGSWPLPPPVG